MRISSYKNQWSVVKKVFVIVALVFLAAGVYVALAYKISLWPFTSTSTVETTVRGVNEIDYSGPTSTDIESSQDGKKTTTSESQNSTTTSHQAPTDKQQLAIGVTYADITNNNFEVRAFTPSIIEGNGTCTATFTKGGLTLSQSSEAFIDSSTTQCKPIYIPLDKFSEKGTWSLTVSYDSPDAIGTAEQMEVNI